MCLVIRRVTLLNLTHENISQVTVHVGRYVGRESHAFLLLKTDAKTPPLTPLFQSISLLIHAPGAFLVGIVRYT